MSILNVPYSAKMLQLKCSACAWHADDLEKELTACPECESPVDEVCALETGGLLVERGGTGNFELTDNSGAVSINDADALDVLKFMLHHWRRESNRGLALAVELESVDENSQRRRYAFYVAGVFHSLACNLTGEAKHSLYAMESDLEETDDGSMSKETQKRLQADLLKARELIRQNNEVDACTLLWEWYEALAS